MSKGFVIEFSVDVGILGVVARFRVLVKDELVQVFEAFPGPFGETAWIAATDGGGRPGTEDRNRIIAWAFGAYRDNKNTRKELEISEGITLIDIGTVKREA